MNVCVQVPTFLAMHKLFKPTRQIAKRKNIINKIIKRVIAFLVVTKKTVETIGLDTLSHRECSVLLL